jgi:hypothetical protein
VGIIEEGVVGVVQLKQARPSPGDKWSLEPREDKCVDSEKRLECIKYARAMAHACR